MKQYLLEQGDFSGGVTNPAYLVAKAIWQGGEGWIIVGTFTQVSGSPSMLVNATVDGSSVSESLVSSPVTTAGIYPFYAPKDAIVTCQINASPGEEVSFQGIFLQGNA